MTKLSKDNGVWEYETDSCGCCSHSFRGEDIPMWEIKKYRKHLKEQLTLADEIIKKVPDKTIEESAEDFRLLYKLLELYPGIGAEEYGERGSVTHQIRNLKREFWARGWFTYDGEKVIWRKVPSGVKGLIGYKIRRELNKELHMVNP